MFAAVAVDYRLLSRYAWVIYGLVVLALIYVLLFGTVTSGGFGPSVGGPVAMGYVDKRCAGVGTALQAEVRHRRHVVHIAELPFIQTRYHKN